MVAGALAASLEVVMRLALASLLMVLIATAPSRSHPSAGARPARTVVPNDNRHAAGMLRRGVLTIRLDARMGEWKPDGDAGPALPTAAFAEAGGPLQTPGPLIRVPVGTEIRATVSNHLVKPMWLYGMGRTRGLAGDSVQIMSGASRELRFRVTEPGTFYYAARTDSFPVLIRLNEDSQLNGIIIVEPKGAKAPPDERIFAITLWGIPDPTAKTGSGLGPNFTVAFNGRTWPHTEHLEVLQGDSVHWRFVNITFVDHPLHLHGFYFRVTAKGDGQRDTVYGPDQTRMGVTEEILPLQTAALAWLPDRSGNWIFHCHYSAHIATHEELEIDRSDMTPRVMHNHMHGLILGITVKPRGAVAQAGDVTRRLRLLVRSRPRVYGDYAGYAFVLGGSPEEANPDAMPVPGPTLELTRGERVQFTIVNQSHDQAAIHWHGIELESYADGVPGVSGSGANVLPSIAPGDSLVIRYTPPRAGTFIYHSHSNEFQQISSGLYGALLVLEPGTRRDPETDRVLLFSDAAPMVNVIDVAKCPPAFLNGQRNPEPIDLRAGVPTRLRLINIRSDITMDVSLTEDSTATRWRILAKDGMPTPPGQAGERPASLVIAAGETYDVEVLPRAGATLSLRYKIAGLFPGIPPALGQPMAVAVRAH
jgi:FtsP/CotA-like multicopper oxidase with cupredoxin domain